MKKVKSLMIAEIGYADRNLLVRFNDGRIYEFKRVPPLLQALVDVR